MNISNNITLNQTIGAAPAAQTDSVPRGEIAAIYDRYMESLNAFSAIVDILAECGSTTLDAGKLYWLLHRQEAYFNDTLSELEQFI